MGRTTDELKKELKEAKETIRRLEKDCSRLERRLEASEEDRRRAEDYSDDLRDEIKDLHRKIERERRYRRKHDAKRRHDDEQEREDDESESSSKKSPLEKKSEKPVELNESLLQQNTVESLKLAAEEAVQQSGFTYDEASGWYYDHNTGYYYDQTTQLYYDRQNGTYYYYDVKKKSYRYHSSAPAESWLPCMRAIVKESDCLDVGKLAVFTVKGGTIGRDKGLGHSFLLPELVVSKCHAEISLDDSTKEFLIKDLGSINGTFVNNTRLTEPKIEGGSVRLSHGDTLRIGSTVFIVHVHVGDETCMECEPGHYQSNSLTSTGAFTKVDKNQQRRSELNRLKKRCGLRFKDTFGEKLPQDGDYLDRAAKRRVEIGSEGPHSPTVDSASVFVPIDSSNKGRQMLEKMGWKDGSGLGADEIGIAEPVMAVVRSERSGLGSEANRSLDRVATRNDANWTKARDRFAKMS
ncbi:angiogenic factor with G patch and FHA domains 1-like [Oscarella lobularis]|uniref:angiogenic factor with G patch and FHA domains 1-like n=1 Tax=Oscarella lobularis TaxID=121494 RepID=UPI0033131E6B